MTVEEWMEQSTLPNSIKQPIRRAGLNVWDLERFRTAVALIPDFEAKAELDRYRLTVDAWQIVSARNLGPTRLAWIKHDLGITPVEHIKTTLLHRFFDWFKLRMLRAAV